MNVIRCLHESTFCDINRDTYPYDSVPVFYGFDCYNDSVEHINKLVDIIKSEIPMLTENDMHITFITRAQSICHAHYTMIWVNRAVSKVKCHLLEDYTIL